MKIWPYKNAETLSFFDWCTRYEWDKDGPCNTARRIMATFPKVRCSIRNYHAGVRDLRKAIREAVPIKPGDTNSAQAQTLYDIALTKAWRKYQAYLRNRDARETFPRDTLEGIAQESGNA